MTVPKKTDQQKISPAELLQAQMIQREQRRIEAAAARKRGRARMLAVNAERLPLEDPAWYYVTKRINADRANGYKVHELWCYKARLKIHLARFYEMTDPARIGVSVVYYAKVSRFIKIGTTQDVDKRMAQYPPDSKLLITEPGSYTLEAVRHEQFAEHLAAGNEWFKPNPELTAHIKNLQQRVVQELRAARQGA